MKTESANEDGVSLIDDIDQIRIRPSDAHLPLDYRAHTVLLILDEDDIVYLRRTTNSYSFLNNTTGQFQEIRQLSVH